VNPKAYRSRDGKSRWRSPLCVAAVNILRTVNNLTFSDGVNKRPRNFFTIYCKEVDHWTLLDNSDTTPKTIATRVGVVLLMRKSINY